MVPLGFIEMQGKLMIHLNSDAIDSVSYNSNNGTLTVWFTNNVRGYDYYRVPVHIYEGLLNASSHGTYFHDNIRDQFAA